VQKRDVIMESFKAILSTSRQLMIVNQIQLEIVSSAESLKMFAT